MKKLKVICSLFLVFLFSILLLTVSSAAEESEPATFPTRYSHFVSYTEEPVQVANHSWQTVDEYRFVIDDTIYYPDTDMYVLTFENSGLVDASYVVIVMGNYTDGSGAEQSISFLYTYSSISSMSKIYLPGKTFDGYSLSYSLMGRCVDWEEVLDYSFRLEVMDGNDIFESNNLLIVRYYPCIQFESEFHETNYFTGKVQEKIHTLADEEYVGETARIDLDLSNAQLEIAQKLEENKELENKLKNLEEEQKELANTAQDFEADIDNLITDISSTQINLDEMIFKVAEYTRLVPKEINKEELEHSIDEALQNKISDTGEGVPAGGGSDSETGAGTESELVPDVFGTDGLTGNANLWEKLKAFLAGRSTFPEKFSKGFQNFKQTIEKTFEDVKEGIVNIYEKAKEVIKNNFSGFSDMPLWKKILIVLGIIILLPVLFPLLTFLLPYLFKFLLFLLKWIGKGLLFLAKLLWFILKSIGKGIAALFRKIGEAIQNRKNK